MIRQPEILVKMNIFGRRRFQRCNQETGISDEELVIPIILCPEYGQRKPATDRVVLSPQASLPCDNNDWKHLRLSTTRHCRLPQPGARPRCSLAANLQPRSGGDRISCDWEGLNNL